MIFRRKSRYVLVETSRSMNMLDRRNENSLRAETLKFLGEKPYIEANPQVVCQLDEEHFIVRVSRGAERNMVLALSFIKSINSEALGFYTIKISGTIRTLKNLYEQNKGKTYLR